jgi:hypothetical protein
MCRDGSIAEKKMVVWYGSLGIIYRQLWHNSNYDAADKFKVLTHQSIID